MRWALSADCDSTPRVAAAIDSKARDTGLRSWSVAGAPLAKDVTIASERSAITTPANTGQIARVASGPSRHNAREAVLCCADLSRSVHSSADLGHLTATISLRVDASRFDGRMMWAMRASHRRTNAT